jgi:hypothetical protein
MNKKLTFWLLVTVLALTSVIPSFAATSGNVSIGLKLYGFEAVDFTENGEGEYVGTLNLKSYRFGFANNVKQVSISNNSSGVRYLKYTTFAITSAWSPYFISTQKVAIKQTYKPQSVTFVYNGPVNKGVSKTVTVNVPALPAPDYDVTGKLIDRLNIYGLQPEVGEAAASLSPLTNDPRYTVTDVKWNPALVNGKFVKGVTYTAEVTVSANDGYKFNGRSDALNIISGWKLDDTTVFGSNSKHIKIASLFDFDSMPDFKMLSFRATFPAA